MRAACPARPPLHIWYTVYQWAAGNGYTFANPGKKGNAPTDAQAPTASIYHPVTFINWRDAVIWCNALSDNSASLTNAVAAKAANELGLFDLSGNVHEWRRDWQDTTYPLISSDPAGPATGQFRIFRGGSWAGPSIFSAIGAFRVGNDPFNANNTIGFRFVKNQ